MIKIMVVEDSEKDALLYKNVLNKIQGVEVYYALSGEEALGIAQREHFDIFVLDIELPGISGLQLAGKLRAMPEYVLTLIMFITGYTQNQLEAFKRFHCYDYIIKPFNSREFRKKIVTLIKNVNVEKQTKQRIKVILYPDINSEVLIPVDQITYAEVVHRRCFLHTDLQEEPFESNTIILKELIAEVDEPYFLQCNKSYAVNVNKIKTIERVNYRLWKIVLRDSENQLFVSSKFYDAIDEQIRVGVVDEKG
ncbi:LytR/AlgR family response regulator transcription factor [Aminipila luticellarii]|uniref:Stage 0 sporulation protein A homolog n=1 Tax=Aminipila luticellarii TaxID=2507160 RepID=A0A410PT83_9FIRM|nr:LytTR family DNA-binding domain-containing protein [Aminipila luticellarii]QAT42109.1 response regulator transcription factor [Aminipila luticellarii]